MDLTNPVKEVKILRVNKFHLLTDQVQKESELSKDAMMMMRPAGFEPAYRADPRVLEGPSLKPLDHGRL